MNGPLYVFFFISEMYKKCLTKTLEKEPPKLAQQSASIKVDLLISRANMCINESVKQLGNSTLINERCLELHKKKSRGKATSKGEEGSSVKKRAKTTAGCPFRKESAIATLYDQTLLEVQDIEQLVTAGRKLGACPYYASRKAVSDAEVVVLPYNTLLHKSTRCAQHNNFTTSIVLPKDMARKVFQEI